MTNRSRRAFLEQSLLAAAATTHLLPSMAFGSRPGRKPNGDPIRIGVAGVRGRGRAHIGAFKNSPDSVVVAICDPDESVTGLAREAVPDAKYYKDLRALLEDDSIDAVSIATPNHWHSLATIWALQAGKHVYVEKPLSHNVFEGRQVVAAMAKYGKIVQHGTQARSQPACRDAIAWMQAGGLGAIKLARGLCYKRRGSIGKVSEAQQPPEACDYNLWIGPSEMRPLMRKNLHYDWHWDTQTGNGDLGNQGVHQMDLARWGLGVQGHPKRIVACGERLGYDDDGNTPNTEIALFDYGAKQLIFEVRGLATDQYRVTPVAGVTEASAGEVPPVGGGAAIGVVFHCENGYLVIGSYNKVMAYDHAGKVIRTFEGSANHFQNFLDAVKSGDSSVLNAPCLEGHYSAALCHLGNVSYALGDKQKLSATDTPFSAGLVGGAVHGNEAFLRTREHLVANGLDADAADYRMGPTLTFDSKLETFQGEGAAAASRLLTRPYREGFVVPKI